MVKHSFSSAKPSDVTPDDDDYVNLLKKSGRWLERLVVTSGEHQHIMIAVLYGFSRASCDATRFHDNEQLIHAAVARMAQIHGTPYFILTDLNLDPAQSPTLAASNAR